MIEKNIFQTFATKHVHGRILELIGEMRNLNPEHRYRFFDDRDIEEYVATEYPHEILTAYLRLNIGAAKADFFRYLVLYKEGGCYLDIDSQIRQPIDRIVADDDIALLSRERNPGHFVQWCIFIASGHRLLERTIEIVVRNIASGGSKVNEITGPAAFSKAIESLYGNHAGPAAYFTDDAILNRNCGDARFMGFDYEGLCVFKHHHAGLLYTNRPHWTREQQSLPVIREPAIPPPHHLPCPPATAR